MEKSPENSILEQTQSPKNRILKEHLGAIHALGDSFEDWERFLPIDIHELEKMCQGNETLETLFAEMLKQFFYYTETICEWHEISEKWIKHEINADEYRESISDVETRRTRSHDAANSTVNALARNLGKAGKDNSWIEKISTSRNSYSRFALLTAYKLIIESEHEQHEQETVVE